ncbi:MAG: UDP-3-O-(3-hydroxymyristoyl)glucosamine N-acyltransferase, partial [Pseudobdellovibrio sp.]
AASSFLKLQQNNSLQIAEVLPPALAKASSLVFVSSHDLFNQALQNKVNAFILVESVFNEVKSQIPSTAVVWTTSHIQAAMTVVLPLFDQKAQYLKQGIHPTAVIDPTAQVHPSAHVGACTVIGAHAKVGADTVLYPHVYVGPFCEIGERCHISAHVTIGSDGFGFYNDKNFKHHKIPQIGKVVIEDDCEFGSHCAIDRATLTETRIGRGSKFDNFCHIAHNVQMGENCVVTAGFIVAGSTIIGKNLMTSGGVHVLGHLKIPDNVILGPRAGVMQDIEKPGFYGGYPLETQKESLKTLLSLPQIKQLRKQVNKILNHLNLKDEST